MILADGALGQMMEKVILPEEGSLPKTKVPWATTGKTKDREHNIITSLVYPAGRNGTSKSSLAGKI